MNLVAMDVVENRRNLKTTVLRREGGFWHQSEINKLAGNLMTEVSGLPMHPEYLILFGHHTKQQTLIAIGGGLAYTATQVTGIESPELPYIPGFV